MELTRFQGAIFDLDGTLLDSMGIWGQVDVEFLSRRGIGMPGDYQKAVTAMGYRDAAEYTIRRFGFPDSPEKIISEWKDMVREEYARRIPLKPGAREYLALLRRRGVRIALATGSGRDLFEPALRRNGVYEFFDAFVTLADVARGKEFPDIYLEAAERMRLRPADCMVFEDIAAGVKSAKSVGMAVTALYDPSSADEEAEIKRIADRYLTDFTPLVE